MPAPEPDPKEETPGALSPFARDVLRGVVISWVSKAVGAALLAVVGLITLLVATGADVPAWTAVLVTAISGTIAYGFWRHARTLRGGLQTRDATIAELQPFRDEHEDLTEEVDVLNWALIRHEVYGKHLAEVIDHLQRVVSGDLDVSIPDYIEKGILAPARDMLTEHAQEDIRLSILLPEHDGDVFWMAWAAGHNLNSREKFSVPRSQTLAQLAFVSGEIKVWDDVTQDDRFIPNPEATRPFCAMVACPLRRGDDVLGVFNSISAVPGAFDPAEQSYLAALAGILSVAVNMWLEEDDGATVS